MCDSRLIWQYTYTNSVTNTGNPIITAFPVFHQPSFHILNNILFNSPGNPPYFTFLFNTNQAPQSILYS